MTVKIGYLGPKGTFSDLAQQEYQRRLGIKAEPVSGQSIFELFIFLKKGTCDTIIIPIENSVEGSINATLDLLIKDERARINHEIVLLIRQCLMSQSVMGLNLITDVFSHPQPLAQCQGYLLANLPQAQTQVSASTARAAEMLSEAKRLFTDGKIHRSACIGNKELAALYGLKILAEDIQDSETNQTRFVAVSYQEPKSKKNDKASVVFAAKKDMPGSLYQILGEFAKRNINLTRIHSRPTKSVLGEYLFYVDFMGAQQDSAVQEAIKNIEKNTSFFRLLGFYEHDSLRPE